MRLILKGQPLITEGGSWTFRVGSVDSFGGVLFGDLRHGLSIPLQGACAAYHGLGELLFLILERPTAEPLTPDHGPYALDTGPLVLGWWVHLGLVSSAVTN